MKHRTIIRFAQLREIVGYSRSQIDRLEKANEFPGRIQLGRNAVGWHLDEVEEWIASRPRVSHPAPQTPRRRVRRKRSRPESVNPEATP